MDLKIIVGIHIQHTRLMNSLFQHCTIDYLHKPYPSNDFLTIDNDETYGFCALHITAPDQSTTPILFHFMIDVSGSMTDIVNNGRTKMQLLIHTLTNMVHYFAENTQNVYIQVKGFDDCIHPYIDTIHVTKENVDVIIRKLAKIRPMQMTNIGLALETMRDDLKTSAISNRVGIFLTDGDATVGELSPSKLVEHIPLDIPFHFIALGTEHNPYMMYRLGHCSKYTNNWFIAEIEQTGNVYGEILYNELHRVATDAKLEIHNGRLYDYHAQEFVTTLHIGSLYADTEKHYHVITTNPDECFIMLNGNRYDSDEHIDIKITDVPPLLSMDQIESGIPRFQHLQRHFHIIQYFRLVTQIILGKARHMLLLDDHFEEKILLRGNSRLLCPMDQYTPFRETVQNFYSELSDHMESYDLSEDEYMKGLCDDISILLQTLGTDKQLKYSALREDIQGQERTCNTVTIIHETYTPCHFAPPVLSRSTTTPHRSPGRVELMNTMSQDAFDTDESQNDLSIHADVSDAEITVPPPIPKRPVHKRSISQVYSDV